MKISENIVNFAYIRNILFQKNRKNTKNAGASRGDQSGVARKEGAAVVGVPKILAV